MDPIDTPEDYTDNVYFLMLVKEERLPIVFPGHATIQGEVDSDLDEEE